MELTEQQKKEEVISKEKVLLARHEFQFWDIYQPTLKTRLNTELRTNMVKIEVVFNPHKQASCRYNSRRVAIDAALTADFVPTAQEAIDAIRASKDTKHLLFQKPQKTTVQVCDKMSHLAAKMYLEIISGEKKPVALLTIRPVKIWILCAINRGIKVGIL